MRKPTWLKTKLPGDGDYLKVVETLKELGLNTVCHEARCPNVGRCWGRGTATIMIMGDICTRSCKFCSVAFGKPRPLNLDEPYRVAQAATHLGIKYLVITSVDRDDLPDYGTRHFAETIRSVKERGIKVEVLVPDLCGEEDLIRRVIETQPDVFGHNLETVRRITPMVRDKRSSYRLSLAVLETAKVLDKDQITKSGIMVGLGETDEEVLGTMEDASSVGVSVFTIGQYLQPTRKNITVDAYVDPKKFNYYRKRGEEMGMKVVAGPLVRSSYLAETVYRELKKKKG